MNAQAMTAGTHGVVAEGEAIRSYLEGLLLPDVPAMPHMPLSAPQGWRRFRVGRLWLALPTQRVLTVMRPPHEIRPVTSAPDEVLGSVEWKARRLLVLDPEAILTGESKVHEGAFWHGPLVVLDSGWWALACESEGESWAATPEDARMRVDTPSRPWLAGVHSPSGTVFAHPDGLTEGLRRLAGRA